MVMILTKTSMILLQNRSARCFGICSMAAAVEEERRRSMNGNRLMNTTWPLQKLIPLLYKAKRPAAGGCNSLIKGLSPAAIKITCWQAVMKYLRGGYELRREVKPPVPS